MSLTIWRRSRGKCMQERGSKHSVRLKKARLFGEASDLTVSSGSHPQEGSMRDRQQVNSKHHLRPKDQRIADGGKVKPKCTHLQGPPLVQQVKMMTTTTPRRKSTAKSTNYRLLINWTLNFETISIPVPSARRSRATERQPHFPKIPSIMTF